MSSRELKTFLHTCDICKVEKITHEKNPPNEWGFLSYATEGGGHYGLPHHYHRFDLCGVCKGRDLSDHIPEWAFDIRKP